MRLANREATAGRLRHQRQPRSREEIGLALIGSPVQNRCNSPATSSADPYRLPVYSWNPTGSWGSQYDLYRNVAQHPAGPFLLLSETPVDQTVLQRFETHQALALLRVTVYRDLKLQLHVYRVAGFKGYP